MENFISVLVNLIATSIAWVIGNFYRISSGRMKILAIFLSACVMFVSITCLFFKDRLFSPVSFNHPTEFHCDQSVYWHNLIFWHPIENTICGSSSDQYMVSGKNNLFKRALYTHVGVQAINVIDNHETFVPASDGRLIETLTDEFHIPLCLSKQHQTSTLLFTFFEGKKVCDTCMVNIVSSEAEQAPMVIPVDSKKELGTKLMQNVENKQKKIVKNGNVSVKVTVPLAPCRDGDGIIKDIEKWVNSHKIHNTDLFCVTAQSDEGRYKKCYLSSADCNQHRENPIDCSPTPVNTFTQNSYRFYNDPPMICYSITN